MAHKLKSHKWPICEINLMAHKSLLSIIKFYSCFSNKEVK